MPYRVGKIFIKSGVRGKEIHLRDLGGLKERFEKIQDRGRQIKEREGDTEKAVGKPVLKKETETAGKGKGGICASTGGRNQWGEI